MATESDIDLYYFDTTPDTYVASRSDGTKASDLFKHEPSAAETSSRLGTRETATEGQSGEIATEVKSGEEATGVEYERVSSQTADDVDGRPDLGNFPRVFLAVRILRQQREQRLSSGVSPPSVHKSETAVSAREARCAQADEADITPSVPTWPCSGEDEDAIDAVLEFYYGTETGSA